MVKLRQRFSFLSSGRKNSRQMASVQIGDAARDHGDWQKAADHYGEHLKEEPLDFDIWVQLGHVLKEAGKLDEAQVAYETAGRLKPKDADLILNLGHLAKLYGKLDEAEALYRQSAQLDPTNPASNEVVSLKRLAQSKPADELIETPPEITTDVAPGEPIMRGAVDASESGYVTGWVASAEQGAVTLEVLLNDQVVAKGHPTYHRADVAAAGFGGGLNGFRLPITSKARIGDTISVRVEGEDEILGSVVVESPRHARPWIARNSKLNQDALEAIKQRSNFETEGMKLSIVMACYNTPEDWLKEALNSLIDQWSDNWELVCVDDASPNAEVRDIIESYIRLDPRIKLVKLENNSGISKAVNAGISASTGDYIAFMDHDDVLEPEAVYRLLDAARSGAGLIYSDEAVTTEDIAEIQAFALRPAFSHDYYLGHPYFVHLVCVRSDIARTIGGYDETMKISADVDFVLRVIENTDHVAHVPTILYRWRTHGKSTGHARRNQVTKATVSALNKHLKNMGINAVAAPGAGFNTFRIDYPNKGGRTLVIIPTKDRVDLLKTCLESIWRTVKPEDVDIVVIDHESCEPASLRYFRKISDRVTIYPYSGPFNFGRMNNEAFHHCWKGHEYILFMNNDIEAIDEGWFERMRSHAGRPEVGVVGANLLYGDGRVQHCGVIIGINGSADHGHKFVDFEMDDGRVPGFGCSLITTRDYSAVTAACMMMRSEVFNGVGGYDEALEIGFNDTDLCLRVGDLGYAIINDAYAVLFHHESATRIKTAQLDHPEDSQRFVRRWNGMLSTGDPFYNPLLSQTQDHVYGNLPVMFHPPRIRPVRPKLRPLVEGKARQICSPLVYGGG